MGGTAPGAIWPHDAEACPVHVLPLHCAEADAVMLSSLASWLTQDETSGAETYWPLQ